MEELFPENDFSQDNQERNFCGFIDENTEVEEPFTINEEETANYELEDCYESTSEIDLKDIVEEETVNDDLLDKICRLDKNQEFVTLRNASSLLNKVSNGGSKAEFETDEERFFGQVVTSKSSVPLNKMTDKELKTLLGDVGEAEKGSKIKSTSKSRPKSSVTLDQSPKESHLENFSCRFCNFRFKGQDELKSHLKTHDTKFKCDYCNYECNSKDLLKQHLIIHNNIKLFKCSVCNYECYHKGNLKTHMLIHGNVKLFKCSHCSYECNQKGSLKIHLLNHERIKLFKCSECTYQCNKRANLQKHMLIHPKLFKCSHCSYECNHKGNLKIHMRIHESVKLFKCSECSYECNQKGSLKFHMFNHENVFKCSQCSYSINWKSSLKNT